MMSLLSAEAGKSDQPGYGLEGAVATTLRRLMLAILLFSMMGTFVDLLLMDHHQNVWQMIPLGLIGGALVAITLHGLTGTRAGIRGVQVVMALFVASGFAGVVLHYQASAAFYTESDSTMSGWRVFEAVLASKVPPTLAPMTMLQMGLIGLAYTYRHPSLTRRARDFTCKENQNAK